MPDVGAVLWICVDWEENGAKLRTPKQTRPGNLEGR